MNLPFLVWSYLKARPLNTILNVVLLALGIAMITILLLFTKQLKEKITANAKGVDLVVGAKGSPMQLILCNIFQVDFPTGNIKLVEAEKIARHSMVKKAIPLALGDSYEGYRIVGSRQDYVTLYRGELAAGNWWKKDLEVVIGANVGRFAGLKIGDSFASAHGLTKDGQDHEEKKYRVTGILQPSHTVLDNLILTKVESIWKIHEHDEAIRGFPQHPSLLVSGAEEGDSTKEITSLLIQYRNPLAVIQLPRFVNMNSSLQAASPAYETARLFSIIGVGIDVLRGFAFVLIVISGMSIFIALYNALKERRYDMAIMRSMGASRTKLFTAILLEGSFLTTLGSLFGLLLGHGVLWLFTLNVVESQKAGMSAGIVYGEEGLILAGSLLLGILCSLVPAVQAYRTDIHKVLAGN